ncbi:KipI family sensor histidine kinase inhibitor [Cryobacterium mesophilum]|uniref:Allophanate hydrolase subunit 1 n=1 Tax=Terrimesophilobacter mesophilus TaxID=433647 RepID=A0A4R8VEA8_9MICO|nr:allophanate hydrolase subunit 1 [Terrimesophilobacter mesophilus]MBB5634053.1 KipI family sensor histidine kinase inhibitor [Terrimesophilobacter mesophilus]TFB81399.1 allophanate hydrolase subunit 1 [Terrimesophilobacter mesophilus]
MTILPFGDRAVLAEFADLRETMAAFRAFEAGRRPGIVELVPAASTVLVRIDPSRLSLLATEQWIMSVLERGSADESGDGVGKPSVTIPVRYDGPDLADAAAVLGITPAELVSRHSLAEWHCAFIGFAPGFAYLVSEYADFSMPRRDTSRTTVPAGSVGLAGEFTGIYPRSSPGGWQLIGTTDTTLFDESSPTPATITPGMSVRFEVVEP